VALLKYRSTLTDHWKLFMLVLQLNMMQMQYLVSVVISTYSFTPSDLLIMHASIL